jgi:2-C-methyl-D-erythritol 4-phosphate cytidylyltransferase
MQAELILLAAGRGTRMGGHVADKVLAPLAGVPVLVRGWRAMVEAGEFARVVLVCRDDEQEGAIRDLLAPEPGPDPETVWARGGAERAESVRAGLAALRPETTLVAVHDAARPLVAAASIREVMAAARRDGAAVLAHRVVDTIKRVRSGQGLRQAALEDLDRATLWAMETPQVFRRDWLEAGYARADAIFTDDAAAVCALGHGVTIVANARPNPKITRPEDLAWATYLLEGGQA